MRIRHLLSVCLFFFAPSLVVCPALADTVHPVKSGAVVDWEIGPEAGREFHAPDFVWTARPLEVRSGDGYAFRVEIRRVGAGSFSTVIAAKDPNVQFVSGRFDPALAVPQLVVSTFSGGEVCCANRLLIYQDGQQWQSVTFPAGAYDTDLSFPRDLDGDGAADFVLGDDRFADAFGGLDADWLPPRIFTLTGGTLTEGTASHRFDAVFRRNGENARAACQRHVREACAALVADSIRLGTLADGWQFMLDQYCETAACTDAFPKLLAKFLGKTGYLPPQTAAALQDAPLTIPRP